MKDIEFNPQFKKAWELVANSHQNLLITGRAGTGKSTFLRYLIKKLSKSMVVLAPTGVAALNVRGQTIHSFFGFKPDITLDKVYRLQPNEDLREVYKHLNTLIIDEISMVRADLFDCIEAFLRRWGPSPKKPFGGVQMVLIGDLYQLPPVVTSKEKEIFNHLYETPYFFSSKAFKETPFEFIEFEKVYRQTDLTFIEILNQIRNGMLKDETLEILNQRVIPNFEPEEDEVYVYLTTTNAKAEQINLTRLERLPGKSFEFCGKIHGKIETEDLPAPLELKIKEGAQVMLVANDPQGRWVNGDIGRVVYIDPEEQLIEVDLQRGYLVEVTPFKWDIYEHYFDKTSSKIEVRSVGHFVQFPLKLAWAITIHKSQGLTFKNLVIDLERGTFAHGQLYVALSRGISLDGIVLTKPVKKSHIKLDKKVVKFLTNFQYIKASEKLGLNEKIEAIRKAIEQNREIEIVYLKSSNIKTCRRIVPLEMKEMSYQGKTFLGLRAFCKLRSKERVFNIEKILEISEV